MAVEIQKTLCGGINIENLIDSMCFDLKISRSHMFSSDFSPVRMFCNYDCLKLEPESTRTGVFPI